MKYSFNTWCYSSYPDWVPCYSFRETVRRIASFGYDAVEIGCAAPQAWPYFLDEAGREDMRAALREYKLNISAMLACPCAGPSANIASSNKLQRDWTEQYFKDCIDLGAYLGCHRFLCVCGWYMQGEKRKDAWKIAVTGLRNVADYAAKYATTVCIEPTATDSNLAESAEDALELMEEIDRPNVKIMLDTAHMLYRNDVIADEIHLAGSNLQHLHIADYDRKIPGTNGLDFLAVMQALKDIRFEGYMSAECGYGRGSSPDIVARKTIENLKALEPLLK